MINSQDIKNGVCIRMDGRLYFVIEFLHVKPGKGGAFVTSKLRDLRSGAIVNITFNAITIDTISLLKNPFFFSLAILSPN